MFQFNWNSVGDLSEGRQNLGDMMPVLVYRLFEYTMRDVLTERYGQDTCIQIMRDAGRIAGINFTEKFLDTTLPFPQFVSALQKSLSELKVGILRIEQIQPDGTIILTVSEDLDCSGMPVLGDAVCNYDEGFIRGILWSYFKQDYDVIEIDCWAKGDRVCRFKASVQK